MATVATVDQFIRHAESGFFGDDEEADCPFAGRLKKGNHGEIPPHKSGCRAHN